MGSGWVDGDVVGPGVCASMSVGIQAAIVIKISFNKVSPVDRSIAGSTYYRDQASNREFRIDYPFNESISCGLSFSVAFISRPVIDSPIMAQAQHLTSLELDSQAVEIIRQASESARANGQTLGDYLRSHLRLNRSIEVAEQQQRAWRCFVKGATEWASANLSSNVVVDDRREGMYDDRD